MNKEARKQLLGRLLRELDEPFHIEGNFKTNWTAPWLKVGADHSIEVLNYLESVSEGRRLQVNLWSDERRGAGRILASITDVPGSPEVVNKSVAWLKSLVGGACPRAVALTPRLARSGGRIDLATAPVSGRCGKQGTCFVQSSRNLSFRLGYRSWDSDMQKEVKRPQWARPAKTRAGPLVYVHPPPPSRCSRRF